MILSFENKDKLEQYLKEKNWLSQNQSITYLEKAGEGNMNFTMRIFTDTGKTFIIKQSRPYVEKYPFIPAPKDRVIREGKFYELTSQNTILASFMPQLLGIDETNQIILTQDLGKASDLTDLYKNKVLSQTEISDITTYLNILHQSFKTNKTIPTFENREMRQLNHEHIFIYPFLEENGLNLDQITPGLEKVAQTFKKNEVLKQTAKELGDIYLSNGSYLLHGDYYFGSFLRSSDGIKVIDPEFCFYGNAEFDLGVLVAHLKLANQPESIQQIVEANYQASPDFDRNHSSAYWLGTIALKFKFRAKNKTFIRISQASSR